MSRTLDLPRDERAPDAARRAVEQLAGEVRPDLVSATRLLVSELVTNSVRHGGGERVSLTLDAPASTRLRCEVRDGGVGFAPAPRQGPYTDPGGWGLVLVDRLVDCWGVRGTPTKVWFELSSRDHAQGDAG